MGTIFTVFPIPQPGGAELSKGDGLEGEHVQGVPGHLPPRGAAAELHRAPGGDGEQPGHPRVAAPAPRRVPRPHPPAPGNSRALSSRYPPGAGLRAFSSCSVKYFTVYNMYI